ncbi:glycosyltransferase family 9 protein [uncultured Dialister sp.]|uniref:glycosyltransferase family 9 protein n=1 Tax=uncultured Dialister sp. TaxID=278064 RepID=UPI0025F75426|nr:glycosyltransferase family 9 protein [uncultured Dialister sp.]
MKKKFKNILIIKMSSLGDIIHALPSLYVLRKTYPDAHITWAVHEAFAGILPGEPWINEIYIVDRKRIKSFSYLHQVHRDLKSHHFDLVIDLQMIAKSAIISAISGCSVRIGYRDAREGSFLASKPISGNHKNDHIIEQLLDVMRYLGCPVSEIEFPLHDFSKEIHSVSNLLLEKGVQKPYVVLVPGTRGEVKKWPVQNWGILAAKFSSQKIYNIVAGSKSEIEMGRAIQEYSSSPYTINLMGKTSLLELAALEKMAGLHISSDTGPLHIANAVHTPIIALFGPTLPDRSGPYGNPHCHVFLADHSGTKESHMDTIPVEPVYSKALEMLHS